MAWRSGARRISPTRSICTWTRSSEKLELERGMALSHRLPTTGCSRKRMRKESWSRVGKLNDGGSRATRMDLRASRDWQPRSSRLTF